MTPLSPFFPFTLQESNAPRVLLTLRMSICGGNHLPSGIARNVVYAFFALRVKGKVKMYFLPFPQEGQRYGKILGSILTITVRNAVT